MPNVRIMNWNIRQLSHDKINIPTMADSLARVVVGADIDILVILELKTVQVGTILTMLTAAMNALLAGGAPQYYWLRSEVTGGEHYGFIVRDVTVIKPLRFAPAGGGAPTGTAGSPLKSLHAGQWFVWPPAAGGVAKPTMPIVEIFATPRADRAAKRSRFAGGGGAGSYLPPTSRGSRAPCLAIFAVQVGGGARTLLPIVVCHYGAVRGGRNPLGQMQVSQLRYLHISQLFSYTDISVAAPAAPQSGFLTVDGAAAGIANLIFTGDFNVDFLENGAGSVLATTNHDALSSITPTVTGAGSAAPAAAAGAAGAPGPLPIAPVAAPAVDTVPAQTLRAACTTRGTMLSRYSPGPPNPLTTLDVRGATFDNFMYGGAQATTAVVNFGVGAVDSGDIVDIPANIVQTVAAAVPPLVFLGPLRAHYAASGRHNAAKAPRLAFPGLGPLTVRNRWIGANLLSDHLPVVLQFACP